MGDPDNSHLEFPFVGRKEALCELQRVWKVKQYRIFEIHGIRGLGKSRLIKRFVYHTLKVECKEDLHVVLVDLKDTSGSTDLNSHLQRKLSTLNTCNTNLWIPHSVCKNSEAFPTKYVVIFDNTDYISQTNGSWDLLLDICQKLVKQTSNAYIFLTSTTRIKFAQLKPVYFSYELPFMSIDDGKILLKDAANSQNDEIVDFGDYLTPIVHLCEGLPLVMIMTGVELSDLILEPCDMLELLITSRLHVLNGDCYPAEDRIGMVYENFTARLTTRLKKDLAACAIHPHPFSAHQAANQLDYDSVAEAKLHSLTALTAESAIHFSADQKKYTVHGIIKQCPSVGNMIVDSSIEVKKQAIAAIGKALSDLGLEENCTSPQEIEDACHKYGMQGTSLKSCEQSLNGCSVDDRVKRPKEPNIEGSVLSAGPKINADKDVCHSYCVRNPYCRCEHDVAEQEWMHTSEIQKQEHLISEIHAIDAYCQLKQVVADENQERSSTWDTKCDARSNVNNNCCQANLHSENDYSEIDRREESREICNVCSSMNTSQNDSKYNRNENTNSCCDTLSRDYVELHETCSGVTITEINSDSETQNNVAYVVETGAYMNCLNKYTYGKTTSSATEINISNPATKDQSIEDNTAYRDTESDSQGRRACLNSVTSETSLSCHDVRSKEPVENTDNSEIG